METQNTEQSKDELVLNWNKLCKRGSLLSLRTKKWQARLHLTLADLGLDGNEDAEKALSPGCSRLADEKYFEDIKSIVAEADDAVYQHAIKFPDFKATWFLSTENTDKLVAKLKDCQVRFEAAVEDFLENGYDKAKAEQLPIIEKALLKSAKDPETAARSFARICAEYPSKEEVRDKYGMYWRAFGLTSASSEVLNSVQDEQREVRDTIQAMMQQLREDFRVRVEEIMKYAKNGKLRKDTIETTLKLCDRIDGLNLFGDALLTQQVQALRNLVRGVDKDNVDADVIAEFAQLKSAIQGDVAAAVAEAEYNLTAVGRRRLEEAA